MVVYYRMRTEAAEQAAEKAAKRGKGRGRQQLIPEVVAALEEMASGADDQAMLELFNDGSSQASQPVAAPPPPPPQPEAMPPPPPPMAPPQLRRASTQASHTRNVCRMCVIASSV